LKKKDNLDYCIGTNEVLTETYKELCSQDSASEDKPCGTGIKMSECTNGICSRESEDPCKMKPDGTTNGSCK